MQAEEPHEKREELSVSDFGKRDRAEGRLFGKNHPPNSGRRVLEGLSWGAHTQRRQNAL